MATQFAMPAPAMGPSTTYNTSPTQYTLFGTHSQPISPVNSANATPQNSSPTSPRSLLPMPTQAPRQLRPLKRSLYTPAVLRPTDPPKRAIKSSPPTPPRSVNNSLDHLHSARPLSRTSTADSGKFGLGTSPDNKWNLSDFPKITEPPTRKHWKVCQLSFLNPQIHFTERVHFVALLKAPKWAVTRSIVVGDNSFASKFWSMDFGLLMFVFPDYCKHLAGYGVMHNHRTSRNNHQLSKGSRSRMQASTTY
jgi:hypothetical protein